MKQLRVCFGLLLAMLSGAASAGALQALENFVRTVKTGQCDFTQVVSAPAKDGQASRTRASSGSFAFARPGRFKFVYRKPFAQTIVADGQTLWLYDVDLNQVSARAQSQALGSTPAALIAAAPDLAALQADFALTEAPERDGLQWVLATPRGKDNALQSVRVGFRGNELAALEILDSFGQRSVLTFSAFRANSAIEAGTFTFQPPSGADVLRQ
jgi:outer membrane lipoprotein carrier protein